MAKVGFFPHIQSQTPLRHVALLRHTRSKFGVLSAMTDGLRSAFERAGIRASVIESIDADTLGEAVRQLAPDCTFGVNISVSEQLLFYPIHIPHVTLFVDTVVHYTPSVFDRPHSIVLMVDQQSEGLFRSLGGKRGHWFPHAIAQETLDRAVAEEPIPLEDRPYDICLPGSYLDPRRPMENLNIDPVKKSLFQDLVQRALSDFSIPFFTEWFYAADRMGLDPFVVGVALESVLRGIDRERLIRSLSKREVTIFTSDEDAVLWKKTNPTCRFHPQVDFRGIFDLCCRSKVVINSAPHIRPGYHERLFLSLAAGAITVTERGRLPQWVVDRGRVVEYDTASLDTLADRVREAEKRPYDREAVLKWLANEHTWDARLQKMRPAIEQDIQEIVASV